MYTHIYYIIISRSLSLYNIYIYIIYIYIYMCTILGDQRAAVQGLAAQAQLEVRRLGHAWEPIN